MTTLDISIVVFCLMIILIFDILGLAIKSFYLCIFGMIFAIVSVGYFIQNYDGIGIGTTSIFIPFQLFIIAYVMLGIIASFVLGLKVK